MLQRLCSLLLLLMFAPAAFSQPPSIKPPVINRPANFSEISGQYAVKVSAAPTEVHVEDPITLRIAITGQGPKEDEPNREYIDRLFPDSWKNDFYVEELPDEHKIMRDPSTWLFIYRLKPKHVKINEIGGMKFVYFNPKLGGKNQFVTSIVDAIKIKVTPKPDRSEELEVPDSVAPESFYKILDAKDVLARVHAPLQMSGVRLAALVVGPPVVCLVIVLLWRRWFPDAQRQALSNRGRSARRAAARLAKGDAAWDVVGEYLQVRYDFAALDPTPTEVAAFLKRRGMAMDVCSQCKAFFQACDAARFVPSNSSAANALADDAVRLIENLEADPCARR